MQCKVKRIYVVREVFNCENVRENCGVGCREGDVLECESVKENCSMLGVRGGEDLECWRELQCWM